MNPQRPALPRSWANSQPNQTTGCLSCAKGTAEPPNLPETLAMWRCPSARRSMKLACRTELKHSMMSWSCYLANLSTASGSAHRNECVALAAAQCASPDQWDPAQQSPVPMGQESKNLRTYSGWPIGVPKIFMPCISTGTVGPLQTRACGACSRFLSSPHEC